MTSVLFSEFVIILETLMRSTLKWDKIQLQAFLFHESRSCPDLVQLTISQGVLRWRRGTSVPAISESTNNKGSCRQSERKDRRRILKIGDSFTQGLQEKALECSACLAEKLANQPVLKVDNYLEESVPEAETGQPKK